MVILRKRNIAAISRRVLFEMTTERRNYKNQVVGLADQIVQNWCLCMYCKLHRPELKETYLHWRGELETHLNTLNRKKIKADKNKATKEVLIDEEEFNDPKEVFKACGVKFKHENEGIEGRPKLGISLEHQLEVCDLLAKSIYDIIDCISSDGSILDYVQKVFPDNNC